MNDWQALRDTAGILSLLRIAEELDLAEERVLSGTQIRVEALERPFATARAWQELALLRNLQELVPVIPLGLRAVPYYDLDALGVLGLGMASCDSLESAFEFAGRYQSFGLLFSRIRTQNLNGAWTITLDEREVPGDCQRFCIDRGLAVATRHVRSLAREHLVPERVSMCGAALGAPDDYRDYFGCEVVFESTENVVRFAPGVAAAVPPSANRKTLRLAAHLCRQIRDRQTAEAELDSRIRSILVRSEFRATAPEVARELGMSGRSLRRQLARREIGFRELAQATKMAQARALLDRGVAVQEVARRVGYSESASFVRAFREQVGQTPGAFAARRFGRGG